jgi:hypothetical protein
MKKLGLVIFVALIGVISINAGCFAGTQDFVLFNRTGMAIEGVYVSHVSSGSWEEDILGKSALNDGTQTKVRFPAKSNGRYWDMKVVVKGGNSYTLRKIDLIEAVGIGLFTRNGRMTAISITREDLRNYQNRKQ